MRCLPGRRSPAPAAFCALLACSTAAPAARAADFTLDPLWIAGGTGSGTGEYGIPESVAIDSLGQVVVTDKGRMMLHVYDGTDGRALFDVGSLGSALGSFDRPNGIAVDRRGRILVVEQINQRVQVLGPDYRALFAFDHGFQKPMGIAIHGDGSVYVTDESRADVQVFDPDGRYLWAFGQEPRLDRVESIEVDVRRARIYVCDEGRSRVNVYDARGTCTGWFGGQGTGPGLFGDVPNAVRVDGRGRIYVNDQGNSRINVYDPETRFVASFRNTGRAMESADGMALSERHDLLLVADQGNDRVLAFDLGEVQCRLAVAEAGKSRIALEGLQVAVAGEVHDPLAGPLWADAPLDFEASVAGGGLTPGGFGLLHVTSRRDRRGVCVRLLETSAGSGVYRARIELGEETDEDAARLATFADDTLAAHFAGETPALSFAVARYGPPRVAALRAGIGTDGRLVTDTPAFAWTFEEDSGRRAQTAFEVRVEAPDGALFWRSGISSSSRTACTYAGPPFPPGARFLLRVRVAAGLAWSDWETAPLHRNSPPPSPVAVSPPDGSPVPGWPVDLRAAVPPDPDGDPLSARIEIFVPPGSLAGTHPLPVLDDTLHYRTEDVGSSESAELFWRVVLSDGFIIQPGPWWSLHRSTGSSGGPRTPEEIDKSAQPAGEVPGAQAIPVPLRRGARMQLAPAGSPGVVEVFDVRGRRLLQEALQPDGTWAWEAEDRSGRRIAPGVYWLRSTSPAGVRRHRIVWSGG